MSEPFSPDGNPLISLPDSDRAEIRQQYLAIAKAWEAIATLCEHDLPFRCLDARIRADQAKRNADALKR